MGKQKDKLKRRRRQLEKLNELSVPKTLREKCLLLCKEDPDTQTMNYLKRLKEQQPKIHYSGHR